MAYSLTDASALGLDLARTPGGVEAAGVLLRGLLPVPSRRAEPVRAPADLAGARTRALLLLGPAAPTVVDLTADAEPPADQLGLRLRRIARRLAAVSFGTVGDVLALAASLPQPAAPGADGLTLHEQDGLGQVLADAALGALVQPRPDPAAPVLARALTHRLDPPAPATPALPVLPPPGQALLATGAADDGVLAGAAALLVRLAAVRDPALLELPHRPAPQVWAQHMHEAAWAVETTGRTRLAAAAQLELLRCLAAVGVDPAQLLAGVWNACSAAVQASVVADVLGRDTTTVLTADLVEHLDRVDGSTG